MCCLWIVMEIASFSGWRCTKTIIIIIIEYSTLSTTRNQFVIRLLAARCCSKCRATIRQQSPLRNLLFENKCNDVISKCCRTSTHCIILARIQLNIRMSSLIHEIIHKHVFWPCSCSYGQEWVMDGEMIVGSFYSISSILGSNDRDLGGIGRPISNWIVDSPLFRISSADRNMVTGPLDRDASSCLTIKVDLIYIHPLDEVV